jgi:polysaccharide pyruvyl transferase WcaK-like protein
LLLDPYPPPDPGITGLDLALPGPRIIGLNVSGLLSNAGGKYAQRAAFRTDYDDLILKLIDFLISVKDCSVLLIPHVFGMAKDSDSVACKRIYNEFCSRYPDRLGLAAGNYDQSQIKYIIGACDVLIGSRMHACIAAVSQAVPAISLAYSGKFVGVMESLGVAQLVADLRRLSEPEVLGLVDSTLDGAAVYRAALRNRIADAKVQVLGLFGQTDRFPEA